MGFHLYPPGSRRGNRSFVARVWWRGTEVEASAQTLDRRAAKRFAERIEGRLKAGDKPRRRETATFAEAVALYAAARDPSTRTRQHLARIEREIGATGLKDIRTVDLVALANRLYPGHKPQSKNRLVLIPAAAVLHYAAENDLAPYLVVRKLRETEPERPRAKPGDMERLIDAAEPELAVLLTVLRFQG